MNICEHLCVTARLFPDRDAILFEGKSWTYARLDDLSVRAARRLTQGGVVAGDRVAILLPNVPAFAIWYFAALRVGAVAVSISTRLAAEEAATMLQDCHARLLVAEGSLPTEYRECLPDCVAEVCIVSEEGDRCDTRSLVEGWAGGAEWFEAQPDDPAVILYTSGTTGIAKGATLSHRNVRSNVQAFNHLCGMRPDDRILVFVPLFHCFGQVALLNSGLHAGATLVLQRRFDVNESKRLIAAHQVSQLYGVPASFQLLCESCQPADLASVRYCFSAAATLPVQVSFRWQEKFGQPIYEGYGLTETSPFASYNHRLRYRTGSIGMPIDGAEMKIVDCESGQVLPPGQLGEIAIRGPNVMLGYWNRPEESAHAIRDGWFYSGDIGRTDERGYFYIVDRLKDMIVVGGLKVYPAEVERVLLDDPRVLQAAVVGLPDETLGERVVAFVVAAPGIDVGDPALTGELLRHCRTRLAPYKVPRQFVPIDELPRNPAGKVLKTNLRRLADLGPDAGRPPEEDRSEGAISPAATSPLNSALPEPTLQRKLQSAYAADRKEIATSYVQQLVQRLTGSMDCPAEDERFLDLGLDSLMGVEMSRQIQAEFAADQTIAPTLVFDHPRVGDLAEYLVAALEGLERRAMPPVASEVEVSEGEPLATDPLSEPDEGCQMRRHVTSLTEEEALEELIRELRES
jgi:long-chain acyl-CoA synthetase